MTREWYKPKDPTPKFQCPCCDYITLPERGMYLICPICFWEDEDIVDIHRLDFESGPNRMTLREGRANFKKIGACDENMLQYVLKLEERSKYKYEPRNVE